MNFYDILGMAPTATAAELKAAYRAKAREYHSDLGGDDEAMKQINRAWDTLGDPEKRKVYDNGGVDMSPAEVMSDALDELARLVNQSIEMDQPNMVDFITGVLTGAAMNAEHEASEQVRLRAHWIRRRAKFLKKREGDNLMHRLIDKKLEKLRKDAALNERTVLVCRAALEMLKDYTEVRDDATYLFRGAVR